MLQFYFSHWSAGECPFLSAKWEYHVYWMHVVFCDPGNYCVHQTSNLQMGFPACLPSVLARDESLKGNRKVRSDLCFFFESEDWFLRQATCQGCHYRPRSEGDNVLGSVRPSVRLSVTQRSYQSKVFVCVSNSRADAVDRLLIFVKFQILYLYCTSVRVGP